LKYTQNYNFRKPDDTDPADIQDLNYNADAIDGKLKEIEDWEAAHLQASNPHSITPEGIGAETPTGAQQKANQAETNAKSYADIVANSILNSAKDYADGVLESANSHTDQVASDLSQKLNETRIKVLDVEQDVSNINKVLINLNPNHEAKQTVSGYGTVTLPKNAANGQVSVTVKGNTETDEEGNTKSTVGAMRIKSVGKNLLDLTKLSVTNRNLAIESDISANGIVVANNQQSAIEGNPRVSFIAVQLKGLRPAVQYTLQAAISMLLGDTDIAGTPKVTVRVNSVSGSFIGGSNIASINPNYPNCTFTVPAEKPYVYLLFYSQSQTTTTLYDAKIEYSQLQLEQGSVATPYEPYTESTQYITAKDGEGNIAELRSLPNGVKDEVNVAERRVIKRTKKIIFDGNENWGNFETAYADSYGFYRIQINGWVTQNKVVVGFNTGQAWNDLATFRIVKIIAAGGLPNSIGFHENGNLYLSLPRDYIDANYSPSIEGMRQYLADHPITLIYQLAMPVETPVQVSGTLVSYPSGTVYIEPFVADAGIYTDKMTVLHQDLPIKALEKLSKIDFTTGLETKLDITAAVIAEDKLSFTHPDLVDGDIVFFTYEYDRESTKGETEIEYYDSRYVIKDSVTGKFYKWHIAVAEGVPSIVLVEV